MTALSALLLVLTASCSVQNRSRQQYAGQLTSPSQTCQSTKATLTVQDGVVVFAPTESTWILTGKLQDGAMDASQSRPGVEHKIYATTLKASLTDDTIHGTYTTPDCAYVVDLKRF